MISMKKTAIIVVLAFTLVARGYAQELPEMIRVEGGSFKMGHAAGQQDELPVHSVTLSSFYIAKTETTVLQWKTFCKATGKALPPAPAQGWNDNEPIANISWHDATAYTNWLSTKTGKKFRVPTEAEWEYAASGGITGAGTNYSGSADADVVSWNNQNSDNQTHEVGKKKPNELGIYDMTGNAWEWTNDVHQAYDSVAAVNPKSIADCDKMVFRGGGFMEPPFYTRVTMRGEAPNKEYAFRDLGLRVVCDEK